MATDDSAAYHYLSMAIRKSSCSITADGVLAVSEPTSESVLDLGMEKVICQKTRTVSQMGFFGGNLRSHQHILFGLDALKSAITSLRRMQCTITMTNPCSESKTAKRTWKRMERLSVMASTADIQVRASRGRTTQELHRDALQDREDGLQAGSKARAPSVVTMSFLCRGVGRVGQKNSTTPLCTGRKWKYKQWDVSCCMLTTAADGGVWSPVDVTSVYAAVGECRVGHAAHAETPWSLVLLIHRHWRALTLRC